MAMKVLLIFAVALMIVYAAPSSDAATEEYRLCSRNAGKCVHVYDNGTMEANRGCLRASTSSVFIKYSKNDRLQFELKSKPRMFLMLKELKHSNPNPIVDDVSNATSIPMNVTANRIVAHEYILVVDYPSKPSLTEWEKGTNSRALVQKVDENTTCAISFYSNGKLAGPCNLSALDSIDLIEA